MLSVSSPPPIRASDSSCLSLQGSSLRNVLLGSGLHSPPCTLPAGEWQFLLDKIECLLWEGEKSEGVHHWGWAGLFLEAQRQPLC